MENDKIELLIQFVQFAFQIEFVYGNNNNKKTSPAT